MAATSLSELPEDLLIQCVVSSFEDAKALGRLSVLSRSWNRMVSQAPSFNIDFPSFWRRESPSRSKSAAEITVAAVSRMKRLKQLRIAFSPSEFFLSSMSESSLQTCIDLVSSYLEELLLCNRGCCFSDLLPCFTRCPKLTHVSLSSGYFNGVPRDMAPLFSLKRCSFNGVIFRGSDLEDFLAKCPALEELCLDGCFSTDKQVVLSSSTMVRLKVEDCSLSSAQLRMPRLASLELRHANGSVQVLTGDNLAELHIDLACSKHVHSFMDLSKIKALTVDGKGWTSERFMDLLHLCVGLRELRIMKHFSSKDEIPAEEMLDVIKRLQRITVCGFNPWSTSVRCA